jgi:hypothetical protein
MMKRRRKWLKVQKEERERIRLNINNYLLQ